MTLETGKKVVKNKTRSQNEGKMKRGKEKGEFTVKYGSKDNRTTYSSASKLISKETSKLQQAALGG